jgi:uncharacterized repeat protein (TIGR04076 family)
MSACPQKAIRFTKNLRRILMKDVVITAKEIKGKCAAGIKVGDKIVMRGSTISLEESDKICGFCFATIFPAIHAIRLGNEMKDQGLAGGIVTCIDPGPPENKEGGRVAFEIQTLER